MMLLNVMKIWILIIAGNLCFVLIKPQILVSVSQSIMIMPGQQVDAKQHQVLMRIFFEVEQCILH